jgi:protein gp37
MNRTGIDWADLAWNPISGCQRGCKWEGVSCYADVLHSKRHKAFCEGKKLPKIYMHPFDKPVFIPERLKEKPLPMRENRNHIASMISPDKPIVFVGSMSDIFGGWVDKFEIMAIIHYVEQNPSHLFLFLTKNPKRYFDFDFPSNVMLGTSVTGDDYESLARKNMLEMMTYKRKTFLSAEPILGSIKSLIYPKLKFVVIGALSGKNAPKPNLNYVNELADSTVPVYLKKNILKYMK